MKAINISGYKLTQFTEKEIVCAVLKYSELKDIIVYTNRTESNDIDPYNPDNKEFSKAILETKDDYYQRLMNSHRVNEIADFLRKEHVKYKQKEKSLLPMGLFPTSIIIAPQKQSNDDIELIFDQNNTYTFEINEENSCLIVDGQHRLAGIDKLYEMAKTGGTFIPGVTQTDVIEDIENFTLNCTFLIGFDKWEQAKVFADVNFNQKPVNRSLYYDIFGSIPDTERNDIYLAHMLALHLNNNDLSPLNGFIKMLGGGKGYFSQAFFVEAILKHFSPKGIWADLPSDYLKGGEEYLILPKILRAYFTAISNVFREYWPRPDVKYVDILCKTTGMGALITLLGFIYKDLQGVGINLFNQNQKMIDFKTIDEDKLVEEFTKIFDTIKDKGNNLFSKESEFGGTGSLGNQSKLYKKLLMELGYI